VDDEYSKPGQLIRDLLQQRDWTQRVLAVVLGIEDAVVSKVISGERAVDAGMALLLGEVLGEDPDRFLNLQQKLDLAKAVQEVRPDKARAIRAQLYGELPVAEMIRRGWIQARDIRDVPAVEAALAKFFGVTRVADIEILPHAAKKTDLAAPVTPVQLAWIYRVKQMASALVVRPYSRAEAQKALEKLSTLLLSAEEARKVPRILADAGIRFVLVETLKSAKIDGVCCWLNPKSPVIGLSCRYDRLDNFWFVVRHEIEHVLRGHGRDAVILDAELEGDRAGTGKDVAEDERVANAAASDFCVSGTALDSFIARKAPIFSERDLLGFSRVQQIHPGIVSGQLQRRTGRYDLFRKHLVKVRSIVASSALVDGWGNIAPTIA